MQDFGQDPRPADEPSRSWTDADLTLDAQARQLLRRLLVDDDGSALPALVELMGARLHDLQGAVLAEQGVCTHADLVSDWFATLLDDEAGEAPAHPLAVAHAWMTARARALAIGLSAQPLPWEDGFDPGLPDYWIEQLGLEADDPLQLYVSLCVLHRADDTTRQVLRDVQFEGLDPQVCAARRQLPVDEVEARVRQARMDMILALEKLSRGGADG